VVSGRRVLRLVKNGFDRFSRFDGPGGFGVFPLRLRFVTSRPRLDEEHSCEQCFRGAGVTLTSGYGPWRMLIGLSNT